MSGLMRGRAFATLPSAWLAWLAPLEPIPGRTEPNACRLTRNTPESGMVGVLQVEIPSEIQDEDDPKTGAIHYVYKHEKGSVERGGQFDRKRLFALCFARHDTRFTCRGLSL